MREYIWVIIPVVIVAFIVMFYNSLVGKKNQVANVFGTVDAMLQKRYDLIPKLIAAVKAYMTHERGLLEEVTKLRAQAMSGGLSDNEKVEIDNKLSKVLGGIMVAVENYPNLRASENFLQLQGAMNEVEEQISAARRAYNAAVTDYNNAVEMFPTNVVAKMMGYKTKKVFETSEEHRRDVDAAKLFQS